VTADPADHFGAQGVIYFVPVQCAEHVAGPPSARWRM